MGGGNPAYISLYPLYILLIREVDNMKIENVLDIITHSILYYYSLIKRFEVTDILISGIKYTILQMWNEYMSDIECEENIDLIGVLSGEDSKILYTNDSNLYKNITDVIISHFDKVDEIDTEMEVLEIFQYNYLPGMALTHAQISNIIEFYLNQ
jgi:hypothetical protein